MGDDPQGKVEATCVTKLGGLFDAKCTGLDYATIFPGECGGALTANVFKSCVDALAGCQACLSLNATDGLDRDCDDFDNGQLDESCP